MSYKGKFQNVGVVLPPAANALEETTRVQGVVPRSIESFIEGVLKLAKPRDWPEDFALNHGHYTKGHPKVYEHCH